MKRKEQTKVFDDFELKKNLWSPWFIQKYSSALRVEEFPANMRHWANVSSLLAHRLRRWPNNKTTLAQRFMFAGLLDEAIR